MIKPSVSGATKVADVDDATFLRDYVQRIPGWLDDYAALRTMNLLHWQERNGIGGPLFEIGVYWGRYLALMLRSALRTKERVVGLDTFQLAPLAEVKSGLAPIADPESIGWLQTFSTSCSCRQLLEVLGGEPRFISIDGSHECDDVFWDLRLAEDMLGSRGIVSVDDFLNPVTMGVNVGVHKFFGTPRNLLPFAYTSNKLFLCRPGSVSEYTQAFTDAVMADRVQPASVRFRENLTRDRNHVEQVLWGRRIVIVP